MKCPLAVVFISVELASAPAWALTWPECVDLASRGNAAVASAAATWRAAQEQAAAARAGFFPQLSASLGGTETGGDAALGGTSTSWTASLTASQNLFAGFVDYGRAIQAAANADAARAAYEAARAQGSYDLKSGYEGLLYAEAYAKLTRDIIRRREDNLRLVELRFESGRENKGSVLLSKAYFNQSNYDNLLATNLQLTAAAQLARVLGRGDANAAPGGDLALTDAVPAAEPPASAPDLASAARATPDYRQAAAQAAAADAGVTVARAGFLPTLAVSGAVGRQGAAFFPQYDRWSVGLSLSVPIFSGLKDWHGTRAAADTHEAAEAGLANLGRQLAARLRQAYSAYVEAVAKFKVDESFRAAAQLRAEIARNKYNNGLLSFEDWDIIESDLINRQKAYLQSKRDRVIAEAAWEQALGQGVLHE